MKLAPFHCERSTDRRKRSIWHQGIAVYLLKLSPCKPSLHFLSESRWILILLKIACRYPFRQEVFRGYSWQATDLVIIARRDVSGCECVACVPSVLRFCDSHCFRGRFLVDSINAGSRFRISLPLTVPSLRTFCGWSGDAPPAPDTSAANSPCVSSGWIFALNDRIYLVSATSSLSKTSFLLSIKRRRAVTFLDKKSA
jgi:hypothetical protein